jgi:hypothetical protein
MSKGSKQRKSQVSDKKFLKQWDNIFNNSKKAEKALTRQWMAYIDSRHKEEEKAK